MSTSARSLVCLVALVFAAGLADAGVVTAATTVTGAETANSPLVINPDADPDTRALDTYYRPQVAFIEKMPVTKRIEEVTVGDLGAGSSCGTSANYSVSVIEYSNGSWDSGASVAQSVSPQTLPQTPGKVSFEIPPTTLKKGGQYSFNLSGCYDYSLKTWAHNGSTINGGDPSCQPALEGYLSDYRIWNGPGGGGPCFGSTEPSGFDTSMPTGWLMVRSYSSSYVYTDTATPPNKPNCGSKAPDYGIEAVEWRPWPAQSTQSEFVCRYKHYSARGADVADGWYWGRPNWLSRDGEPRDTYLRLDTIDYDSLLQAHSPALYYDADDSFHALSPAAATDFYDEDAEPGDELEQSNQVKDGTGGFATANGSITPALGLDLLSLSYLDSIYSGSSRRNATSAATTDFISERGDGGTFPFEIDDYEADSATMEARLGYPNQVQGRVVYGGDGGLWLQYWIYYYYDSQGNLAFGVHEGDWEMVQVRLNDDLTPVIAAYAQHGASEDFPGGERCGWGAMDSDAGHPRVYVAQASHASYFRSGHYNDPSPDDNADGDGPMMEPTVSAIDQAAPSWVTWPGRWGDSGNSPKGPRFQGAKWDDPSAWADSLVPCDVD